MSRSVHFRLSTKAWRGFPKMKNPDLPPKYYQTLSSRRGEPDPIWSFLFGCERWLTSTTTDESAAVVKYDYSPALYLEQESSPNWWNCGVFGLIPMEVDCFRIERCCGDLYDWPRERHYVPSFVEKGQWYIPTDSWTTLQLAQDQGEQRSAWSHQI